MLEIYQNLEQAATRFPPLILIVPGLALVLIGLFVWLGGLGFRKALLAVTGAVTGGIGTFLLFNQNFLLALIVAAVFAALAVILKKIATAILAAILAVALAFVFLAQPLIEASDIPISQNQSQTQTATDSLSIDQALEITKSCFTDFADRLKQTCTQISTSNQIIILVLAIVVIAVGFFFWRLTSALCCATLGTMLIFAGMISLLLYKGSEPLTRITDNQPFYARGFAAMVVFGVIVQMLLTKTEHKKTAQEDQKQDKDSKA